MHNACTWTWAIVKESPTGYLVPGRVCHGGLDYLKSLLSSLCHPHWIYIPPIPRIFVKMLRPFIFSQKCSTQSVKTIPYVSLYLFVFPIIWYIPWCPCPLPIHTLTPIPYRGYYSTLWFLLRTWKRINMVRKSAHQVKFELDLGDWLLGLLVQSRSEVV